MDAQSRSIVEPDLLSTYSFSAELPVSGGSDDDFPTDLSSAPEQRLVELCDALFLELDSETPDLRAMERYQTICDELTLRQMSAGMP
jgi:hypothetical protein